MYVCMYVCMHMHRWILFGKASSTHCSGNRTLVWMSSPALFSTSTVRASVCPFRAAHIIAVLPY